MTGLNNVVSANPTRICGITFCSILNTYYKISTQACILDNLTDDLPKYPIDPNMCLKNLGFTLADTQFHKPGPVDIVIGNNINPNIILRGVKQNILFLSGPITQPSKNSSIVTFYNKMNPECLLILGSGGNPKGMRNFHVG